MDYECYLLVQPLLTVEQFESPSNREINWVRHVTRSQTEWTALVGAGLAAVGTAAALTPESSTGIGPLSASAVLLLGAFWRGETRLRRRAVVATLTGVSALGAAGWGFALTGGVTTLPVETLSGPSVIVAVAAVGTCVGALAGAGIGSYRAATPDDETGSAPSTDAPQTPDSARTDDADSAPTDDTESTARDRVAEQKRAFYFLNNLLRHHVLNGLNVIEGYVQRIDGDPEATDVITQRTEQMTTVVQNVRAIADVFSGDPELAPADLTTAVERVRSRADEQFPQATVTAATPDTAPVWSVGGDDAVLWELVENGVVHGGREPSVHIHVTRTESSVLVYVLDDGPGLDPDDTAELFEPGTTGDQGLGLYLARTLVRYSRGEVAVENPTEATALDGVESPEDRLADLVAADGTCVTLRFPRADDGRDPPETPAVDETVEHAIGRKERR